MRYPLRTWVSRRHECAGSSQEGLIIEISDEGNGEKADALALRLREVLGEHQDVRVTRPVRCGELRVTDIYDSVSSQEIVARIAEKGGYDLGAIEVAPLRVARNGMGSAWIRCPLQAALKIQAADRPRLG